MKIRTKIITLFFITTSFLVAMGVLFYHLQTKKYLFIGVESSDLLKVLIFVISFIVFVSFFVSSFVVEHVSEPIEKIHKTVRLALKGNLNVKTSIKTGDEIEVLGKSINSLIEKLKKSEEGTTKKISEKTKTLEKLNESMVGREVKVVELKKEIDRLKEKLKNPKE